LRIQHRCVLPPFQTEPIIILSLLQSVVDLVLQSNPKNPAHAIHKHGTPAYIIGQGSGAFNWSTVAEAIAATPTSFNLVDPPLRDGFLTTPSTPTDYSWTVIRYKVPVNTVTFMHCHINEHLFGGMAVVLLEGVDNLPPIPEEYLSFQQRGTF
jgi:FtsP/CotA-like multicopper oxidase with cupredoxin domain